MWFLTYHPHREDNWREFKRWPVNAVRYYKELGPANYRAQPLLIFWMSDDRENIVLIPESEWDRYAHER